MLTEARASQDSPGGGRALEEREAVPEGPILWVDECVRLFPVRGAPGSCWHLFTASLLLFSCQPWNSPSPAPAPSDTPILTLLTPPHFARSCLHLRFPYGRARGRGESQKTGSWMRPRVPLSQRPKRFRARPWVQEAILQHQPPVPQSKTLSTWTQRHTPQAEGPVLPDCLPPSAPGSRPGWPCAADLPAVSQRFPRPPSPVLGLD